MTDDTLIDITNFRTFVWVAVVIIFFGVMAGVGFYITFGKLHITLTQGLQIIIILFITCGVIAYIPYLYRDWRMKWGIFAPEDTEDDDE